MNARVAQNAARQLAGARRLVVPILEPTGRYPDVIARSIKRHEGINTHRADTFAAATHKGIPVTTPAQTIIHLSAVADIKTLRRAVNEALNRRLITLRDLITHSHRGATKLRAVLATAAPTRSENENAVLALLHDAGIPKPLVNAAIEGTNLIPDVLWPTRRSSSRPIRGATTTSCSPAPTTGPSKRSSNPRLTVIRTSWAEITTRPDRMIARVSAGRAG